MQGGVTNTMFEKLFEPVIKKIMDVYDPNAIVLQCGADSLAADRLGSWALSIRGTHHMHVAHVHDERLCTRLETLHARAS